MNRITLPLVCTLAVLLIVSSCTNEAAPDGLLNRDTMVTILMDMHIADAVAMKSDAPIRDRTEYKDDLYKSILFAQGIDKDLFYESYQYYLLHPEQMNEIYLQVIERLNETMPSEQKRIKDLNRDIK